MSGLFSEAVIAAISGGRRPPAPKGYKLPSVFPSFNKAKRISFDLESLDPSIAAGIGPGWRRDAYIVGFAIALGDKKGNIDFSDYYPMRHKGAQNLDAERTLDWLATELAFYQGEIVGTNLLYDFDGLQYQRVSAPLAKFRDIQWAEALIDEHAFSYGLNTLAKKYLGEGKVKEELKLLYGDHYIERFHEVHPGHARAYGLGDVELPMKILDCQQKILHKENLEDLYDLESRLLPLLLYMREQGTRVDLKKAAEMGPLLVKRRDDAIAEIAKMSGVAVDYDNFGTPVMMKRIFDKMNIAYPFLLSVEKGSPLKGSEDDGKIVLPGSKGYEEAVKDGYVGEYIAKPSFRKVWLEKGLDHPITDLIMLANSAEKARGTFVEGYIGENAIGDRIHCEFHPLRKVDDEDKKSKGTITGRFSAANPNLQNIPTRDPFIGPMCRSMFIADEGMQWWSQDYSQIEYRMLIHFAVINKCKGAEVPQAMYLKNPKTDFHDACAEMMYKKEWDEAVARHLRGEISEKEMKAILKELRKPAKCLDGDTVLSTRSGLRTIKAIIGDIAPNEHRTIPLVELSDGRDSWTASTQGLVRHERPSVFVITRRGIVCCTADHRWSTINGLVEASKLTIGEHLTPAHVPALTGAPVTVRFNPISLEVGKGPATILLDEKWAYFAGLFQGDGCANEKAACVTHGSDDSYDAWRAVVAEALRAVGFAPSLNAAKTETYFGSTVVVNFLQQLELAQRSNGKKHMRVPSWVLAGGSSIAKAYLAGLFDTDGTVSSINCGASITNKHPEFVGQIAVLFRSLGQHISIAPGWNEKYQRYYYRLCLLAKGLKELQLPLQHPRKALEMLARVARVRSARKAEDDEVLLVLDAGKRTVYDFHVDNNDHLYLQGGLLGHNNLNFGMVYGMGTPLLAEQIGEIDGNGKPTRRALAIMEQYHNAAPYIKPLNELCVKEAEEKNFITTILGRRGRFNLWQEKFKKKGHVYDKDADKPRSYEEAVAAWGARNISVVGAHKALNKKLQGSAADLMKLSMVLCWEAGVFCPENDITCNLTVHDELNGSFVPSERGEKSRREVKEIMEHAMEISIPILTSGETGANWSEAK